MRVKALTAFVTRLGGEAVSVARSGEQELPDERATLLVEAGVAASLEEQPEPEPTEEERLAAEKAEQERLEAEKAEREKAEREKAEAAKKAAVAAPKKGAPSGKKLDGAPENK